MKKNNIFNKSLFTIITESKNIPDIVIYLLMYIN
jgi:hypothetical protein